MAAKVQICMAEEGRTRMTESARAMKVMGVPDSDQRRSPRRSVHAGGTISTGDATYVAWVKDISEGGVCLFTKHRPNLGDRIQISLSGARIPAGLRKAYEGKVVRVQDSGPGTTLVGVAIMFGLVGAIVLYAA